jgi:chromosome segregation ATPase
MEIEQILKRVDWLDEERRKDKNVLASLEERISFLAGNLPSYDKKIRELEGEIDRQSAKLAGIDRFEEALMQQRVENKHALSELEKDFHQREEEAEKVRRVEIRALESDITEFKKELAPITELKRSLQARIDEDARLSRAIDEVRLKVEAIRRSEEEYTRTYRLLEDGRRQDSKKITDLEGEISALRKHVDDQRGKMELSTSSIRKVENRLNELSLVENERREAQAKFLEQQTLVQVERDREWKEWRTRFDAIESQASDVETSLQALDATHRAVQRSQTELEQLNLKVDRRVNEMSEIQRLSEERFRQEWVTFKADDQKRWTNYTLTQEEQRGEMQRQHERLAERITHVEDSLQEIQDLIVQMNEQNEKQLQSLLAMVHDWVSSFERTAGRVR